MMERAAIRMRTCLAGISLIASLIAAGCGPKHEPRVRIGIGGQAQLVYLPTTLAERLGHFRDHGIEVELIDFQGGAKALEALFGGSVDVVSGFYDHTVQMAAAGKPLVAFVSMMRYPGLALIASPDASRKITTVKDLSGANVGVSAPGSSTHLLFNHLLIGAGLKPESASAIGVGMAAGSVAAMENGKVDAAVMSEPAISQLERRKGKLTVLADTRTAEGVRAVYGVDSYPAAVLYSKKEWVEGNEAKTQGLARALKHTLDWIGAHTAEEIAAKMPAAFAGGDVALYSRAIEQARPMYSQDGVIAEESAKAVVRVMTETMIKQPVAWDCCFTAKYLGVK